MSDFEKIEALIATSNYAGEVPAIVIQEAEKRLGSSFPPSYKIFLSSFGAAVCSGFEIAGLFQYPDRDKCSPLWLDVVAFSEQRQRASGGLIPESYVAISDDGGDYTFYLDTSRTDSQNECPVVALGPGVDSVVVARNFVEFLSRCFSKSLSY